MADRILHVTEPEAERIAALRPGECVQIRRPFIASDGVSPHSSDTVWWDDDDEASDGDGTYRGCAVWEYEGGRERVGCPYGQPGDRLMVVETFAVHQCHDASGPEVIACGDDDDLVVYRDGASNHPPAHMHGRWRPPEEMPAWAVRSHLTIESVRVEDRIDGDYKHWYYWVIDARRE